MLQLTLNQTFTEFPMTSLFFVALGGAIGSCLRYGVSELIMRFLTESTWPLATYIVNISGGFAMGVIFGWFSTTGVENTSLRLFLATGILGGFTTFSAFSLELYQIANRGSLGLAVIYGLSSVLLSLLALVMGLYISRALFQ